MVPVGVGIHLLEDGGDVTKNGGIQQRCKQRTKEHEVLILLYKTYCYIVDVILSNLSLLFTKQNFSVAAITSVTCRCGQIPYYKI